MSRLAKVGAGTDHMWGLPGVEIRAEVQKGGMTPLCPGLAQVLSETGGQTKDLGKERLGCGDVLGVLIA